MLRRKKREIKKKDTCEKEERENEKGKEELKEINKKIKEEEIYECM